MTRIRVLLLRILDPILRRRRDARLDDEIQTHLDLLAEEYMAGGMDPVQARSAARRAFGGVDQVRAVYRDARGLPPLDSFVQDLRFGVRLLRRDPGFAALVVLVLGLGIGVNNMFFTILYTHTLRGLPIDRADRVVSITAIDSRAPDRGLSYPDFDDIRSRARRFASLAAFTTAPLIIAEDDLAPERVDGAFVSADAFAVIGVQPVLGRTFTSDDDRRGAPAVALLGSGVHASRYGSDAAILGRPILVNGTPATVIGVLPERSGFPSSAEVWLPLWQHPGATSEGRAGRDLRLFGRLHDDATFADAQTEVEAIVDSLAREHAGTHESLRARVAPINERYLGRLTEPAWLAFMTAGCLIVLISCANVANLLLARSARRTREMAIRTSLGASRGRVMRQLLIEGSVLAALGGAVGLVVSLGSVRLFASAIPEGVLPYWFDYSLDSNVLAALVAVSAATVLAFCVLPAFHASRTDVNHVLKDGGYGRHTRRRRRWTTAILTAELALAVVLLAHLGVSIRSAGPDLPAERALDTREIVTAAITLPAATYRTAGEREAFYRRLHERLGAIPGISSSMTGALPLAGAEERHLLLPGRPATGDPGPPRVRVVAIGPRYFETLGVAPLRGRELVDEDGAAGHDHVVVNERFARAFLASSDAIGQPIAVSPIDAPAADPAWLTIVGVVPTIRQRPAPEGDAVVYRPYRAASPASAALVVRSSMEATGLVRLLRAEVQAIDPLLPLYNVRTMAQVLRDAEWNSRLSRRLFLYLTSVAVALATAGLFTVAAYGVSQRTREIGLRMALGARPRQVVRMILRLAAVQAAVGFAAGIACTKLWDWMFSTGIEVRASDPSSLLIAAGLLTMMTTVACFVPARRAARLDPVSALREG